jgi:SAM-dependent methyltransferase
MNKRLLVSHARVLSLIVGFFCVLNAGGLHVSGSSSAIDNAKPGYFLKDSSTLENALDREISFFHKPVSEDIKRRKQTLSPGETTTFSMSDYIEIKLPAEDSGLIYWLVPGEHYVIKSLGKKEIGLFKLIEGGSSIINLAPFVPTPASAIGASLKLAGVDSDSVIYDLGCGDGSVIIQAAKDFGARGVGVEIDVGLIEIARKKAEAEGVSAQVTFINNDIFETDISAATIVYLYLFPQSMKLLRPYLEANLKKGTTVASFGFAFPGWENRLVARHEITGDFTIPKYIYIYRL